jgi:hypothetical protein
MFSLLTIVRIAFNIFFAYGNLQITNFINHLEKQKNCPCSTGWKITNGKFISSLLFIVGLVNIFISANKILYSIPLIGSGYVFIFVFMLFMELFIMTRITKNLQEEECKGCNINGFKSLCKLFRKRNTTDCIYVSIIVSIVFFYL